MDYISQSEKLFKFFELELDLGQKLKINEIRKKFCNDLNLFACFIKDYLTLKNSFIAPKDENIYSDFVLFFQNIKAETVLDELDKYSTLFLKIVFEEERNPILRNTIAIVNSCYLLEYYSVVMYLANKYYEKEIDIALLDRVLKAVESDVLANFEKDNLQIDLKNEFIKYEKILLNKERMAS